MINLSNIDSADLKYLTPAELADLDEILSADAKLWKPLPGPQTLVLQSKADIIGMGGAAGGGKTDLIAGLSLTEHKRALILRREKAQTEGVIQRITEIIGDTSGYNSQKSIWRVQVANKPIIEFGGLDNAGDERRWQGRPHDIKAFDEVTEMREDQVRFIMGWVRTNDRNIKTRILMTFNPPTTVEGRWVIKFFGPWLDKEHPNPAKPGELRWFTTVGDEKDFEVPDGREFVITEDGSLLYDFDKTKYSQEQVITPKSRTFIPARVTDNPYYVKSGYIAQLQALPEPLRSQMLHGDFSAGMEDDPWQVCPTAWVQAAQARWKLPDVLPEMDSLGVDVARGGKDKTIISRRHTMWFNHLLTYPGKSTPDGPEVAGLTIAARRDEAVIHIDVIGIGASPFDFLNDGKNQVIGVNVSESPRGMDKTGQLTFYNYRTELCWRMREALDPLNNTGIALPPDPELLADLCAFTWKLKGREIYVLSRDEIVTKIGRSPDKASAVILALIDTPKTSVLLATMNKRKSTDYNPYDHVRRSQES